MRIARCVGLLTAWLTLSGFPCFIFCGDQTSTQREYVAMRDECREYAEQRAGASADGNEKNKKTLLVKLFSDCMNDRGWAVPGPTEVKPETLSAEPAAPAAPVAARAPLTATPPQETHDQRRARECAYARYTARNSSVAAKRAHECDRECAKARKKISGESAPACAQPEQGMEYIPAPETTARKEVKKQKPMPAKRTAKKSSTKKKAATKPPAPPQEISVPADSNTPEGLLDKALSQ